MSIRIERVQETGSTNADVKNRIREGEGEGFWLSANSQTGGRGRFDRQWVSPPGNLYCSTLVRPTDRCPPPHSLAFVTALAVRDTLAALQSGLPLLLKWPNDLLLGGGKCAGILLEAEAGAVVVGIGVNIASAPVVEGKRTACLAQHDFTHSPDDVLDSLARHFELYLSKWRREPLAQTLAAWQAKAHPVGTLLTLESGGLTRTGRFAGLDDDGGLRLSTEDGKEISIKAGDVTLVG